MFSKKISLLYILEIFRVYSDSNHLLTQQDIIDKLNIIYSVQIERKTISTSIDLLIEYGYDIIKGQKGGYYLNEREFDESEIKFLIDAIYSSRTITGKQAISLSKKLNLFLSKYQQKDYNYLYKSQEINRTINKDIFLNIEIINEAINNNNQIQFTYLKYTKNGELTPRKDGYRYTVSPYFLINNFGKYYLISNIEKYDAHLNFRIDYMKDIVILDKKNKPINNVSTLGKNFNITKHINDHVYMFGGNVIKAKIEILDINYITYIKDWFSNNAYIFVENDKIYAYITSDDRAFVFWALQYQQQIKIIDPLYIKEKIINILKESLNHYID